MAFANCFYIIEMAWIRWKKLNLVCLNLFCLLCGFKKSLQLETAFNQSTFKKVDYQEC